MSQTVIRLVGLIERKTMRMTPDEVESERSRVEQSKLEHGKVK